MNRFLLPPCKIPTKNGKSCGKVLTGIENRKAMEDKQEKEKEKADRKRSKGKKEEGRRRKKEKRRRVPVKVCCNVIPGLSIK